MYSCAVTADSKKKELQRRVSSKVRHWCSKFIWCCHSSKQAKAMKCWHDPMRGYYRTEPLPKHPSTPSPPKTPPNWGVIWSRAGPQFTRGNQARQFVLNKAFRYKSRATTGYLSCLWRPPLPLACLLPWRHLTYIHPSCLTGVKRSKRGASKMQSLWRQYGKQTCSYKDTEREGKLSH